MADEEPSVIQAFSKLETVLLISLCAAEIETCQLVTCCINVFLDMSMAIRPPFDAAKQPSTIQRNGEVFGEIASPAFRFTGPVAFQKRTRGLLRRMAFPTPGILGAWLAGFDKWLYLSKDVSTSAVDTLSEKLLAEWRNYSGLLASLGGICTAEQVALLDESLAGGLLWIDRISSETHEEPVLSRFLRLSIQLLACGNFKVREAMREVLSSDIPPPLYQATFRALQAELDVLFAGALAPADRSQDAEIIFAEQAASLLKALVEKLETPADLAAASSVHLGALTLNFAKFMDGSTETSGTQRVKIKVCQLCEAVTKRKEHMNLRNDVQIRNQLLEKITQWISPPRSVQTDMAVSASARIDDVGRMQKDVDRTCLRSLADLTYRLPLQPSEGQADAPSSDIKSQMFHRFFNRFLSLLDGDTSDSGAAGETASTTELAITILSNLLSANIDVGLKHSLSIGHHENPEIRSAFVKVLCNILTQGTEFSNLSDASIMEKYDELLQVLTSDTALLLSMVAVCPSHELDELAVSLLTIFEHRGLAGRLIGALVRQEIENTGKCTHTRLTAPDLLTCQPH